MVSIDHIKQLRKMTGVSMMECKKALEEANGDFDSAKNILTKWGKNLAGKRSDRVTSAGIIESYIHPNKKVGVLLELSCETDFVARSDDFKNLAHELCLQIAALNPLFASEEEIPEVLLAKEIENYNEQIKDSGKPQKIVDQIIEGKLKKYKIEVSLISQVWIKDDTKTVKDLIDSYIAKIGENIVIKRFVRFEI